MNSKYNDTKCSPTLRDLVLPEGMASWLMLYLESVSKPFFGFPRCLKLMVKQNALLAVRSHYLGTGHQVGSPPTGQEVQWLGERF